MSMFIHDEFIRLFRTYVEENAMTEQEAFDWWKTEMDEAGYKQLEIAALAWHAACKWMREQNKPDLTMTLTDDMRVSLASDGCALNPGDQFKCYKVHNAEALTKLDGYVLVQAETIPNRFADYLNGTLPEGYSAGDMADQGAKQFRAGYVEGQKDMREACARVCDNMTEGYAEPSVWDSAVLSCSRAIRMRSNP